MRTHLRACLAAGWLTGLAGMCGFGLAHAIFISPLVAGWGGPSWTLYPGMFAAPFVVGVPAVAVAGAAMGGFWFAAARKAGGNPPQLRWVGAVPALLLVPAASVSAFAGPFPDGPGTPLVGPLLMGTPFVLASAAGWRLAGGWGAAALALSGGLLPFLLTPFAMSEPMGGLVGAFVASVLAVWVACGHVMERLVRRLSPPTAA